MKNRNVHQCSAVGVLFLLLGLTASAPATAAVVSFSLVADTTTTIPGGLGSFTSFSVNPATPPSPCMSFGNVAFFGAGAAGQAGVYATLGGTLTAVADQDTVIPGASGADSNFIIWQSNPFISGNNVTFAAGNDGGTHQGVYASLGGTLTTIADLSTLVPGSLTDTFIIWQSPAISGSNVVFLGQGSGGQSGVYATLGGTLTTIADLDTLVPGSATEKFIIWQRPAISGSNVAFLGYGSAGQRGVYAAYPPTLIFPVAEFGTPVPGQPAGTFFDSFASVSLAGTSVAFVGSFDTGKDIESGVYVAQGTATPVMVADAATPVPGGFGNFTLFLDVAIDPDDVVFKALSLNASSNTVEGLYNNAGGVLIKIVDSNDSIGGKQVSHVHLGPGGFSGNQVAFAVDFADGSQAIALATLGGTRCPLSQGYWKNHPAAWPESSLTLGSQSYTQTELLAILGTSGTDASLTLARQLIAAKLSIANGSDPAPASAAIADGDGLLAGFAGKLPYQVKSSSTVGQAMLGDAGVLDSYAKGLLTPGCTP